MAARFSRITSDKITYDFWLAFDDNGGLTMSRAEPALGPRDRSMSLQLTIPRTIFRTPQLKASITLQSADQPRPVIDVQAAEEAIRAVTGMDVVITVKED